MRMLRQCGNEFPFDGVNVEGIFSFLLCVNAKRRKLSHRANFDCFLMAIQPHTESTRKEFSFELSQSEQILPCSESTQNKVKLKLSHRGAN